MVEMNAYYAHDSAVGPVFDVATFSRRKMLMTALVGLVFAVGIAAIAAYCWNPDGLLPEPPQWYAKGHEEAKDLLNQYPLYTQIGAGLGGLVALAFVAMVVSMVAGAFGDGYYLRAGEGGISLRIQSGLTAKELDLPWFQVKSSKVVSEKKLGSMSRNAGNLGAYMDLRTNDGRSYHFRLDDFREPGHIIYERLVEAQEMTAAQFDGTSVSPEEALAMQ